MRDALQRDHFPSVESNGPSTVRKLDQCSVENCSNMIKLCHAHVSKYHTAAITDVIFSKFLASRHPAIDQGMANDIGRTPEHSLSTMWIRTGLLLVWTLSFASSVLALHAEDASSVKFSVASTRDEAAADKNDKHPSNSPAGRRHHAREIVEISDPTTDSTLHLPQYPIDCTNNKECDLIGTDTTPMPTFRPYTQEELNGFLKKYVANNRQIPGAEQPTNKLANIYMEETVNVLENGEDSGKSQEKSKSWQLMQGSPHKNSYDDKTGWVTLEPVPWSASQIQKWEPNKRPPGIPQWNEDPPQTSWQRPAPNRYQDKPWNNKNTYVYRPQNRPWGAGDLPVMDHSVPPLSHGATAAESNDSRRSSPCSN
ncbi:unnamed protein product [Nesidiocoris tenuis]|uniref:Uncharacterized protein n=1 Tax=Nesidiocoris tenuis TaxID=355587 RepID=A0A6H5GW76_9HEMI|nr:unnamed protein product [Nesidiocoris tenuis]